MSADNQSRKASDILKALHALLLEPEENIRTKSLSEIQAELKQEGINSDALFARLQERLNQIKAQEALSAARQKRISILEQFSELRNAVVYSPETVRQNIAAFLKQLSTTNPQAATAFFRKFEEASDADLQSLLEDLEFLDQEENNQDASSGA